MERVFICAAARTAIGSFGGALVDTSPVELGRVAAVGALERAGKPAKVDEVIVGNVLGAGHGMNIARQVALKSGLAITTPAYTVNKVCGSGLKAVTLGATEIALGNADVILAGGTESMSQAAFVLPSARWGARMGNTELKDLMLQDGLTDVFHSCHMGVTAENIASKFQLTREEQDDFALQSQLKAKAALERGDFKAEIVPVPLMKRGKPAGEFLVDEYPRKDSTKEGFAALKPAFKKDGGTVTAGNSSGINDGAAMVVLGSQKHVTESGKKPLAEILGWASGGVEPEVMGLGPVEAVRNLIKKTGIKLSDVDVIEANEAFAAQSIAVNRSLEWDTSRVNVSGGAIALGHPIGASGARALVTLVHQLHRLQKKTGIATLCIGGGQGIAILIARV